MAIWLLCSADGLAHYNIHVFEREGIHELYKSG